MEGQTYSTANELQAKRQWDDKGRIREDSLEEVLLKTVPRGYRRWERACKVTGTACGLAQEVKGKEGDEVGDVNTDQASKSPVIFLLRRLYFIWKTMGNDKGI